MIQDIARLIDHTCVSADYTIAGVTYPAKIRRSIVSGDTVIKHVYLTTKSPNGTVTRCRLLDQSGVVRAEIAPNKAKEKNKGRLFQFKFKTEVS